MTTYPHKNFNIQTKACMEFIEQKKTNRNREKMKKKNHDDDDDIIEYNRNLEKRKENHCMDLTK